MLNIVLLGPPGAGKGTQSKKLLKYYSLLHIAPGNIFREHIQRKSRLGKKVAPYLHTGELVPDELVIQLVSNHLAEYYTKGMGLLFDGYPRRIKQAAALEKQLMCYTHKSIDCALLLEIQREEMLNRLLKRATMEGRSDDQDIKKIQHRWRLYEEETYPIFEYYKAITHAYRIAGKGAIEEVYRKIAQRIDKHCFPSPLHPLSYGDFIY